jgi:hypothetical protein
MSDAPNTPTETSSDPAVLTAQTTGTAQTPSASGILGTPAEATAAPPQPTQTAPQPSPVQQADQNHHYALGKMVASIFGQEHQYSVDPKTGETISTSVKQAPGTFFRNLVAGAILGGAIGSTAPGNSPGVGALRGAGAVLQNDEQMDDRRRAQAQQQFNNQKTVASENREDQKLKEEETFRQAQAAQWTAQNLAAAHEHQFQETEFAQKVSEYNTNLQLKLADMNVQPLTIMSGGEDINGKPNNGADITKLGYDKIKALVPTGYTPLPIQSIDEHGFHSFTIYAVPPDAMKQKVTLDANDLKGFNIKVPKVFKGAEVSFSQFIGLNDHALTAARDEARDARANRRESDRETHESLMESSRLAENKLNQLKEEIKTAQEPDANGNVDTPTVKRIQGQIDALGTQQDEIYNRLRNAGVNPQTGAPNPKQSNLPKPPQPGAAITPDVVKQYLAANGNDPAKARQAASKDGWTMPGVK